MNLQTDQMTLGVGDDVTFAALDLLACIKVAWTAAFRSLDRLPVDDTRARAGLTSGLLARGHHQHAVDINSVIRQ